MSVGVGLRVGTSVSSVAVTSPSPGRPDPEPIERRTAVHLHSDGTATLGEHHVADGNTSSFTDFVDRLGRSNGVRANDGALSRAEDLVATAMECLIADAGTMIGDANYTVVASHPTDWPPSTVALLRNALDYVGLRHVSLISDAEASAAWFESQVAHQTGRLVAVYHIDPHGTTVTLVRSGVVAGKAFRFAEGDAPSVSAQLSTALGAFGWLVTNLDAIVVTLDETVDTSAAQIVAQSIKAGLGVRCALAPDPHQTMVRGAALAAAAGSVDLLGSTQVLPAARPTGPKRGDLDPETTTVIAKITPTAAAATSAGAAGGVAFAKGPASADAASPVKVSPAADPADPASGGDERGKKSKVGVWAAAAAVAVIVAAGVLVFSLRDSSTASATPPAPTPTPIFSTTTQSQPKSTSATPTTSETSATTETAEAEYTAPGYVATDVPQTQYEAETSNPGSSTTTEKNTSTTTAPTSSSTGWSRRNPPNEPSSDSGGGGSSSSSQSPPAPTSSEEPEEPEEPEPEEPVTTTAAPSTTASTTASDEI